MRRVLTFDLRGVTLFGTLDEGSSSFGLLIVSGGNEIRIGAHRGMARLAQVIGGQGHPVFRFDRRGIGDSEGENVGFRDSADDLAAAVKAFRDASPNLKRIVAFGNCDAATALILHDVGFDALVLANPWIVESVDALPPPAAIRARYARRLRDPRAWRALVSGRLDIRAAIRGLHRIAVAKPRGPTLSAAVAASMAVSKVSTTIILADGDNTAIAFANAWQSPTFETACARGDIQLISIGSSSHSFANETDFALLVKILEKTLAQ